MEGEENKDIQREPSPATLTCMVSKDVNEQKSVPGLEVEPEPDVDLEDELQIEPDVAPDVALQLHVEVEPEVGVELGDEFEEEPGEFLRPLLASLSLMDMAPFPPNANYLPRLQRLLPALRGPGPPYAVWMGLLQARLNEVLSLVVSASGIEGEPVVGRAYYCGLILPASVDTKTFVAYVEWEGEVSPFNVFEVLIVLRGTVEWMLTRDGDVPAQALPVGLGLDGETVYVARVFRSGHWRLGRVMPSEGACMVVEEGTDLSFCEYEVLVINCS